MSSRDARFEQPDCETDTIPVRVPIKFRNVGSFGPRRDPKPR